MKRLILVRHGKAEDNEASAGDFQRSLTAKGKYVSSQMAIRTAKREKGELTIVSSPAFRAIETALIFVGVMKSNYDEIVVREAIYGSFGLDALINLLVEIGDDRQTVMLFGHNPSFSLLVNHFSGNNRGFLPKTGVACLEFKAERWEDISKSNAELAYSLNPDGSTD
jgi:phosphohistidine phosphatase